MPRKWLHPPIGTLTSRMKAEIRERRRRLMRAHPKISPPEVRVDERWEEHPGGRRRHLYTLTLVFSVDGKAVTVEGRPDSRGTLAIAQAFRAAADEIHAVRTGRVRMTTGKRRRIEVAGRRRESDGDKRYLSPGTTAFRPPIFIIGG